jgi:3-deoxy-7-phosphoheptulonate synthase
MDEKLFDQNVDAYHLILTPEQLKRAYALSPRGEETIAGARQEIRDILDGRSSRKLYTVGPCSIHSIDEALEYARRLKLLAQQVRDDILVVMRAYMEKPRTTVGWKGLINDPYLNGTFDVEAGLAKARRLLVDLAEMGVPTATEALDPITYQYLSDLTAWASIGARTTESQTHRQMASGISAPVGFKNNTQGNIDVAVNAMRSAMTPHRFLGIDEDGRVAMVTTRGNPYGHVILRGGEEPNYDAASVDAAVQKLKGSGLRTKVVIDCSHGNSRKEYRNQPIAFRDVLSQMIAGNEHIAGLMLESNLEEGSQPITNDPSALKHGVSITDACIGWAQTEELVLEGYERLREKGGFLPNT